MNLIKSTLTHKVIEPRRKSAAKAPALILLHGRGANEEDLINLVEYFDERLFVVSVRAPFPFQGGGGYTWYEVEEVGKPEPKMFDESYRKLSQFISDVKSGYPVDPARVILCGFSMGTIMSFSLVLTHPDTAHGVMANSGLIPEGTGLTYQWEQIRAKPFFIAHGTYDPVIPVSMAQRARDLLLRSHAQVTYREYDIGHQISEESLNDMMKWLGRQLPT